MQSVSVKQDKYDEAETYELTEKTAEAKRPKMSRPQRYQKANILSPLINQNNASKNKSVLSGSTSTEENIDAESFRGIFGWTTLGRVHIPYIFRREDKYCAVRMVEEKLLNKYFNFLHQDIIYSCTCVTSDYITDSEVRLLNEINVTHCDYQFGKELFTTRDLIVRLGDVEEFYNYLSTCYNILSSGSQNVTNRCGFIKINKESVVPYTVYKKQKYVPLFYFEGETDNLKLKTQKLEGWDLSYLKFCFRVQGVKDELCGHDSCSVVGLNDIKSYFPPGTLFEDYWPHEKMNFQLLIKGKAQAQTIQWTKTTVASSMTTHQPLSSKVTTGNSQTRKIQTRGLPIYHAPEHCVNNSADRFTYTSSSGVDTQILSSLYAIKAQAPPPLLRTTQPVGRQGLELIDHGVSQVNQQPVHQQFFRSKPVWTNDRNTTNGCMSIERQLTPLPDPPTNGNRIPYHLQNALVQGKTISCINMKPYVYTELLVTLPDLVSNFLNKVPLQSCQKIMSVLGIKLYKGNSTQMRILYENGKCQNLKEVVPLVRVRSIIDYMPQLKSMTRSSLATTMESTKRQKSR